jgi:hypothetical protein
MTKSKLHVLTTQYNPLRWSTPERNFRNWATHMLDSGVVVTVCELQYGNRPYVCNIPYVRHIGVRSDSWCWSKENLLNLALRKVLPEAQYICWEDADVYHRDSQWANKTMEALEEYYVVQTWSQCIDLGPEDEVCIVHHSLSNLYTQQKPVTKDEDRPWWTREGGEHEYAHPGFSWACRKELLKATGGFFDVALFGSGDYHMALSMIGKAEWSLPEGAETEYRKRLLKWQDRAKPLVQGKLGAVPGTLEHRFHGNRHTSRHLDRWQIMIKHRFDPAIDIRRNGHDVWEWSGNKPRMELEWSRYLMSRNEDANYL